MADRVVGMDVRAVVVAWPSEAPRSKRAPDASLQQPAPSDQTRSRMHVAADVTGSSNDEVTFYARSGHRPWRAIGADDTAPYQVFHNVNALPPGTHVHYRAVVRDNAGHTRTSGARSATAPLPLVTIEAPIEGSKVRGAFEVRAVADPEKASHVVSIQRSVDGRPWNTIGTDRTSPTYTAFEDLTPLALAAGTAISYRAVLTESSGDTAVSALRNVKAAGPPITTATVRYLRPGGDHGDPPSAGWGLHLWGDAVAQTVIDQVAWDKPWPRARVENGWAVHEIPLKDDTKAVNFIMHLPSGDTVPSPREPGGDRSFTPLDHPEIWLVQGDPTVHFSQP
jgi:alpha-amylase